MHVELDSDVQAVAAFMQDNLTADRLVPVTEALAEIALALWGHFERSEVRALSLGRAPPISAGQTPANAI